MTINTGRGLVLMCLATLACGGNNTGINGDGGNGGGVDACVGLQCQQNFNCPGGAKTRLVGTVYTPKGDLPLPNIKVFVPNAPLADFPPELTCDRCDSAVSGSPIAETSTGIDGTFVLEDLPSGSNIPVVVQNGRWRMAYTLPTVAECMDNTVPASMTLRLPRTQKRNGVGEGDIPRMAITLGSADALECLVRKMGIDDSEFGTDGANPQARIHFYTSNGTDHFTPSLNSGATVPGAVAWWGVDTESVATILARLEQYDIVIHSCEGSEFCNNNHCPSGTFPSNKPSHAMQALQQYADNDGRVFMSHFHHTWMEYNPDTSWSGLLTWTTTSHAGAVGDFNCNAADHSDCALIDIGFGKARALATWLTTTAVCGGTCTAANGSPSLGYMRETTAKNSASAIANPSLADRWIYLGTGSPVQFVSANTPITASTQNQCGRIVFSDVHVSAGSTSRAGTGTCPAAAGNCANNTCNATCCTNMGGVCNGNNTACNFGPTQGCPFPVGCSTTLTPQEKALIYMMFDLASCVGVGKRS